MSRVRAVTSSDSVVYQLPSRFLVESSECTPPAVVAVVVDNNWCSKHLHMSITSEEAE